MWLIFGITVSLTALAMLFAHMMIKAAIYHDETDDWEY